MMATFDVGVLLTAVVLAAVCGLLGSFLVLRRMALLGDVVSHAVVPGIVVAYLWSGVRELPLMLLGAGASAGIALVLVQFLQHRFGWSSDAALGAVLSSFFAVGVLLLSSFGAQVDLDVECVLYGEIAYVPFDSVVLGGYAAPRAAVTVVAVLVVVMVGILLGYRRLVMSLFDPEHAAVLGVAPERWQKLLLFMAAAVAVVGFELVGVIVLLALLVLPAATAQLLRLRLPVMVLGAVFFGVVSALLGYGCALVCGGAISGWIALVAGVQVGIAALWRWIRQRKTSGQSPPTPEYPLG